uniref:Methyltransferase n=1 Tax=Candidatus Kentrum sp. TC TaxID=2126339 RepID=A0A450ZEB7_9GAMM|nr:MAG: DNA methylase [Candidatus Kentron sp. TC]
MNTVNSLCELNSGHDAGPTESVVFQGEAERILRRLPSGFFRCCVTSPPYWGLRDYRVPNQIGAEGNPDDYVRRLVSVLECVRRVLTEDGTLWLDIGDSYTSGNRGYRAPDKKNPIRAMSYRARTPRRPETKRSDRDTVAACLCFTGSRLVFARRYYLGEAQLHAGEREGPPHPKP